MPSFVIAPKPSGYCAKNKEPDNIKPKLDGPALFLDMSLLYKSQNIVRLDNICEQTGCWVVPLGRMKKNEHQFCVSRDAMIIQAELLGLENTGNILHPAWPTDSADGYSRCVDKWLKDRTHSDRKYVILDARCSIAYGNTWSNVIRLSPKERLIRYEDMCQAVNILRDFKTYIPRASGCSSCRSWTPSTKWCAEFNAKTFGMSDCPAYKQRTKEYHAIHQHATD